MPLYWTIDSKARLFTGVADGDVSLNDAIDLLEAMAGARAMAYRKLFDGRAATPSMPAAAVRRVERSIRMKAPVWRFSA